MAMPFPSTDAPTEARFDNVPKFEDLDRLSLGEIADMPPALLLALQEEAAAETARVKRLKDRFEAALAQRYGAAPRAFLVAPLVGAFFIDFNNALIITGFLNFWPH